VVLWPARPLCKQYLGDSWRRFEVATVSTVVRIKTVADAPQPTSPPADSGTPRVTLGQVIHLRGDLADQLLPAVDRTAAELAKLNAAMDRLMVSTPRSLHTPDFRPARCRGRRSETLMAKLSPAASSSPRRLISIGLG
jgi:hypothetical protein